jgi:hypothetical protein
MGKLNIINDLFLGLQELNRQQKFIKDDGYVRLFSSLINNFGIVNVDSDTSFDNFKVEGGTNTGTIKIGTDSYAVDKDVNIIYQQAIDNFAVTDDSNWYWVRVSYQETNLEEGTINLATNGDITGVGTKFSEVLRDQSNYPVKVNFPDSSLNTGDYQVTSVLSDTSAILSGTTGFTAENDLSYRVVGSYTPGINPSGSDRLPYIYDSCNLELVLETVLDTPPAKVSGEEFYVARVRNSSGTMTIQDKRSEFLSTAKEDTGWVQPTLGVNFTNILGEEVEYRKNYLGEVEVRGAFTCSSGTDTLFTLPDSPINFRPSKTVQGIYGYEDGSVIRVITVDTNGEIKASTTFPFEATGTTNKIVTLRFNVT